MVLLREFHLLFFQAWRLQRADPVLFYIHIGSHWKRKPLCQREISARGR
jgi:hypothetical protein